MLRVGHLARPAAGSLSATVPTSLHWTRPLRVVEPLFGDVHERRVVLVQFDVPRSYGVPGAFAASAGSAGHGGDHEILLVAALVRQVLPATGDDPEPFGPGPGEDLLGQSLPVVAAHFEHGVALGRAI